MIKINEVCEIRKKILIFGEIHSINLLILNATQCFWKCFYWQKHQNYYWTFSGHCGATWPPSTKPHMAGSLLCDYTVACAVSKRKGGSSYMEKVFSDCTATSCHCGVFWLLSFSPNLHIRGLLNQWFLQKTEAKEEIIFWEVNGVFPTETGSRPNPVSNSWVTECQRSRMRIRIRVWLEYWTSHGNVGQIYHGLVTVFSVL